jgi:hypothetical protein
MDSRAISLATKSQVSIHFFLLLPALKSANEIFIKIYFDIAIHIDISINNINIFLKKRHKPRNQGMGYCQL